MLDLASNETDLDQTCSRPASRQSFEPFLMAFMLRRRRKIDVFQGREELTLFCSCFSSSVRWTIHICKLLFTPITLFCLDWPGSGEKPMATSSSESGTAYERTVVVASRRGRFRPRVEGSLMGPFDHEGEDEGDPDIRIWFAGSVFTDLDLIELFAGSLAEI